MRTTQRSFGHILAIRILCRHDQVRSMVMLRRIQDRSWDRRIPELEKLTKKYKIAHKVIIMMEALKRERYSVATVNFLARYRQRINLPRPHKISDFLCKSPELFELYRDRRRGRLGGQLWCGLTQKAEELFSEREKLIKDHEDKAAENLTRLLMMCVDKKLSLRTVQKLRRDFGFPRNFCYEWVNKYPELFKLSRSNRDGRFYLRLMNWQPRWAITELERQTVENLDENNHTPGVLSLRFPLSFAPKQKNIAGHLKWIEAFQKEEYLSPYADARELRTGMRGFKKRAVAVIHELLSFTVEKRFATTDSLTHFHNELKLPEKLMRILLNYNGIFYVSERGVRLGVYLLDSYNGGRQIKKPPLVLWKEKLLRCIRFKAEKKKRECCDGFNYTSEMEDEFEESENEIVLDNNSLGIDDDGDEEMEVEEICKEYS